MKCNYRLFINRILATVIGFMLTGFIGVNAYAEPTALPTVAPTVVPVTVPTVAPTVAPTVVPTTVPAALPTGVPAVAVSQAPVVSASPLADGTANTTPFTQVTEFVAPASLTALNPLSKCFIVFGDSRSCSLACTIITDKTWTKVYVCNNYPYADVVATKGDTIMVICAEAGGYYDNGAYTRAYSRFNKINNATNGIKNSITHYYCNLFGVNDVMIARRNSTSDYVRMDEAIRSGNKNAEVFYQFTAGPISETGTAVLTNAEIEKYNSHYKNTKRCAIIDLYSYLVKSGFDVAISPEDTTGLHYDSATNYKILGLILSLGNPDGTVTPQAPAATATPAATVVPAVAPTVVPVAPTVAPTVVPVVPTAAPTAIPVITPTAAKTISQ